MRIISGSAKGRLLKAVPGKGTRPTSDKVKEAIFSMIGPYFEGGAVLDLFAGTGALGIEALSRGKENAVFIDLESKCMDVIRQNLQIAGFKDRAEIYRNDASKALKALSKRRMQFDLVFLDPPYKLKYMEEILQQLESTDLLTDEAVIVVEHDASNCYMDHIGQLSKHRHVVFGDTAVSAYCYRDTKIKDGVDVAHE